MLQQNQGHREIQAFPLGDGHYRFEKKIEGLCGARPPRNYKELLEESRKWPRVGKETKAALSNNNGGAGSSLQKTGFLRKPDFSYIYAGIDDDVDKLIE